MLNLPLKDLLLKARNRLQSVSVRRPAVIFRRFGRWLLGFVTTWWHTLIVLFAAIIFLYYPIGGLLVSNIDRSTNYEISDNHPEQSGTVEMMAFIINREVNEKIWTPNLPFFFPSYFLDNMPNFQLGMFDALSKFASSFSKRLDKKITSNEDSDLSKAAELLRYPGTVWMFSAENKLLPAPSANSQYRRARKRLITFNQDLSAGTEIFYKSPADLAYILNKSQINLKRSHKALENHIREESHDWFDTQADNIFYYQQGKAYAYYLLMKALGHDYQDIIVAANQYQNWTKLLKALEEASSLAPAVVRNGELDSLTAPNHLSYLELYILKAQILMKKIADELNRPQPAKEH